MDHYTVINVQTESVVESVTSEGTNTDYIVNIAKKARSFMWQTSSYSDYKAMVICAPIYLLVSIVIFVGNTTTIVAITLVPKLHTKTNMILRSLCISDILVGVVLVEFVIRSLLVPEVTCSNLIMMDFFAIWELLPIGVSLVHLVTIAIDRYVAITWPLHYEMMLTETRTKLLILCSWMIVLLLVTSYTFWYIAWDPASCASPVNKYFDWVFKTGFHCFLTPGLVLIYSRIYSISRYQRKQIKAMEIHNNDLESKKAAKKSVSEYKATMMTITVALVTAVLWAPYHIILFLQYIGGTDTAVFDRSRPFFIMLGTSNSAVNIFIYAFMNKDMKAAFVKFLHLKPFIHATSPSESSFT